MMKQMRSGSSMRFRFGRFCKPRVCIYSKIQTDLLQWQAMGLVIGYLLVYVLVIH
jgi:hypothetical protein